MSREAKQALGFNLLRMVDWWVGAMEENAKALGLPALSRTQAMLIAHVSNGEHRPIRLAKKLGVTRQAVYLLIGQLTEKNLISLRKDPHDGRASIVEFTETHSNSGKKYKDVMSALERYLVKTYGQKQFEIFREIASADWGDYPIFSKEQLKQASSD